MKREREDDEIVPPESARARLTKPASSQPSADSVLPAVSAGVASGAAQAGSFASVPMATKSDSSVVATPTVNPTTTTAHMPGDSTTTTTATAASATNIDSSTASSATATAAAADVTAVADGSSRAADQVKTPSMSEEVAVVASGAVNVDAAPLVSKGGVNAASAAATVAVVDDDAVAAAAIKKPVAAVAADADVAAVAAVADPAGAKTAVIADPEAAFERVKASTTPQTAAVATHLESDGVKSTAIQGDATTETPKRTEASASSVVASDTAKVALAGSSGGESMAMDTGSDDGHVQKEAAKAAIEGKTIPTVVPAAKLGDATASATVGESTVARVGGEADLDKKPTKTASSEGDEGGEGGAAAAATATAAGEAAGVTTEAAGVKVKVDDDKGAQDDQVAKVGAGDSVAIANTSSSSTTTTSAAAAAAAAPATAESTGTDASSSSSSAADATTSSSAAATTAGDTKPASEGAATSNAAAGEDSMASSANAAGEGDGGSYKPRNLNFKDALAYLAKVKMQFADDISVYNNFLEIMKDFKLNKIETPGVIKSVSELFVNHEDLIVGFNTFLPSGYSVEVQPSGKDGKPGTVITHHTGEGAAEADATAAAGGTVAPPAAVAEGTAATATAATASGAGTVGPTGKGAAAAGDGVANTAGASGEEPRQQEEEYDHAIKYVNKIRSRFVNNIEVYRAFLDILHMYQNEDRSINEVYEQVANLFQSHQDLLDEFSHFLPEAETAAAAHAEGQRRASAKRGSGADWDASKRGKEFSMDVLTGHGIVTEEMSFFEKIKKSLRPAHVYENFLRCLILFSNEIINREELVTLVDPFLRRTPELFTWFKGYIGFKDGRAEGGHKLDVDLSQQKRKDISYRALPQAAQDAQICTGRAKLDREIVGTLNDGWVSFPTFGEDSSYVATKKNVYEEAIFRCEDERFELDIILEANLLTIRVLEMVMHDLKGMTPEERKAYKFDTATLGGSSETIHRKCVRRLYGDRANEVIEALARNPYHYIPIVLKRLKQKHSEWRNTQRQWNQIWREINEKNYLKSLDHKFLHFKKSDTAFFKPKNIKTRMRDAREEFRKHLKMTDGAPVPKPMPPPVVEFSYDKDDARLLGEVEELLLHGIERISSASSDRAAEKEKMRSILCQFLPEYLHLTVERTGAKAEKVTAMDTAEDSGGNEAATSTAAAATEGEEAAVSTAGGDGENGDGLPPAKKPKMAASTTAEKPGTGAAAAAAAAPVDSHTFLANGRWFVLHSLHQLLYDRVRTFKRLSERIAASAASKLTEDNDLPVVALALRTPAEVPSDGYFDAFKSLTKRLVENKIETSAYEESMRELFNTKAYISFTLDKLIQTFAKQLQGLVNDANSESLHGAYQRHQAHEADYDYKGKVIDIQEGSLIYIINTPGVGKVHMELMEVELQLDDGGGASDGRWLQYVNDYTNADSTDPRLAAHMTKPIYLRRNQRQAGFNQDENKAMENAVSVNELECKIVTNGYKLKFVSNTGDVFYRKGAAAASAAAGAGAGKEKRHKQFREFVGEWAGTNVGQEQTEACAEWMTGKGSRQPVVDGAHSYARFTTSSSGATDTPSAGAGTGAGAGSEVGEKSASDGAAASKGDEPEPIDTTEG